MMSHKSSIGRGNSNLMLKTAAHPEAKCVSMQSDTSMNEPYNFSRGEGTCDLWTETQRTERSCSSMKSDKSRGTGPIFSSEPVSFDPKGNSANSELVEMTSNLQLDSCPPQDDVLHRMIDRHKTCMRNKYESLFEGIKTRENKTLLNTIYTQLYITEGERAGVNEEHDVLQIEKTSRKYLQYTPINCSDIFKSEQDPEEEFEERNLRDLMAKCVKNKKKLQDKRPKEQKFKTVLTKGIAGIGKTVSVQKFILDWAEGKANQDIYFMFVLSFRKLNLIKDYQYSLHRLLCDFHPELKDLEPKMYDECKVVFIFDGLDENRIPLNFLQCEKVTDITKVSSVDVLITNLITGELLPSALIWITSRPAAANQIPSQYISRVTEIQGFNDPQKEEYFRKRISDQDQADSVISHIKKTRSLHIMCHIPVFCRIIANVFQQMMSRCNIKISKSLTLMYTHFLIAQTIIKKQKYGEIDKIKEGRITKLLKKFRSTKRLPESEREIILKLAELAFKQLMKGNVMFYEEDLRECNIDGTEASVYSGICMQVFREECVPYQRKVYCFVHFSFQEFLAAVYVFHCYVCKKTEALNLFQPLKREQSSNVLLYELLKGAVCEALKSPNGHLGLFLDFLLGICLEPNQNLLQGLMICTKSSSKSNNKIVQHIKKLINAEALSTDRCINLFLCLTEVNDQSLFREIQVHVNSEKYSETKPSPG